MISKIFPDDRGRIDVHADYDGNIYSIYYLCDEQTCTDSIDLFNSQYIDISVPFKRMQCRILLEEQIKNNLQIDTHGRYIIEELRAENRTVYEEGR